MSDSSKWVRHQTHNQELWSPVPENHEEQNVSVAGLSPNDSTMEPFGPVKYKDLEILPPAEPTRVIALAHNYRDLVSGKEQEPLVFLKTPSSVIGPGQSIKIPQKHETWSEVELAFVVDKTARNINPEEADDFIKGYTIANDVTTKGIDKRNWHLPRSKARETFCPTGPHLVRNIDTENITMETYINDKQTQNSTTANRIYDEREALSVISSLMTVEPGDLILTGTPAGATESIISPGDMVTVNIKGVGQLQNPVVLTHKSSSENI